MARSIPVEPSRLPRTAVRGWVIPFNPEMKRTAAAR
jgi:hypothetical protein